MSEYSEFDKEQLEGELAEQLAALRKKDRTRMLILSLATGLLLIIGVGYYVADTRANSANAGILNDYQTGYGDRYGSGSAQYAAAGSTGADIGGGCCGGSGSSGSEGGCGSNNGSFNSNSLTDLEKQALAEYSKKTGVKDVTPKASDFGCHFQVDIIDKTGNIVRSYGFQGGPLYVIK